MFTTILTFVKIAICVVMVYIGNNRCMLDGVSKFCNYILDKIYCIDVRHHERCDV